MRRREILRYWMQKYGKLSPESQDCFLQRRETFRLTRYPDEIVRKAINWSNLLSDALSFAHSAYEGEPKPTPPEAQSHSQPGKSEQRAKRPSTPSPDLEPRLRRVIGPVQNYEDSF